jgi:hypothetical protein
VRQGSFQQLGILKRVADQIFKPREFHSEVQFMKNPKKKKAGCEHPA